MKYHVALILALLSTPALAQPPSPQAPDPAFLQQAISSLQGQRNEAMDRAAIADANHRMAAQEVEKLKGAVAQLQKENSDLKARHPDEVSAPPATKK